MSVIAYTGLPGSGKTYSVVEHQILPALRAGRRVVTNIRLHKDRIRELVVTGELVDFPTEAVKAEPHRIFEFVSPGSVFVLDEVWHLFPAGLKANHVPDPYKKLLAEHRHMVNARGDSTQIVLVTQDLSQISAFARQLVESTFRSTKLSLIGASGTYRVDVFPGPAVGPAPPLQSRVREIFGRYDRAVFDLYVSHTMSEKQGGGANEKAVDARANVWRRPSIILMALAIPILLGFGFLGLSRFKSSVAGVEAGPARQQRAARPEARQYARASSRPRVVEAPEPVSSSHLAGKYRVAGFIHAADETEDLGVVLVTDGQRVLRLSFAQHCRRREIIYCDFAGGVISEATGVITPVAVSSYAPVVPTAPPPTL